MALDSKRQKNSLLLSSEAIQDSGMRNSRGLQDQWADTVRPRTTERHITVHRKLVMGFAISILALIVVTIIAVLLSVRFEECSDGSSRTINSSILEAARFNQNLEVGKEAGDGSKHLAAKDDEEEDWKPWTYLRLPTHLRPLHYNLMITAFMDNFTFSGELNVEIECLNSSRYIVVHAHRLTVERVQVAEDRAAGDVKVSSFFAYQPNQVLVVVLNRSLEVHKSYNLKIIYTAIIENELLGFFRSSYVIHGERRLLGVTQFSPIHARKAFPCFDEPIYKATFKISIK
ncbi:thyrotropin-releasing hormone-degrading ectoenzyme-like, partial [Pyxicephalus adspersus]|uniref:thyrotropin-releasing hormone-degrading ectoenzyme-like n=1 Tax=Pyxicephalus adspersus TaxID=30357 RepID=UPI003B5C46AE